MIQTNNQTLHPLSTSRRGFTLMETVLAMVLGGMVLVGCVGVFMSIRSMDKTFEARYQRTSELDITHTAITRAMLALQLNETQGTTVTRASDVEEINDEPEPRDRIILETDPTVAPDSTGWVPQRLELVCATPPVPAGLATQAAEWYTAQNQQDSVNFSALDGSQGAVRGVFELRPAGQREQIMQSLGLIRQGDPILREIENLDDNQQVLIDPNDNKPNWTLWWRPILNYEYEQLLNNQGPYPDTIGSYDEIRARLAGSVPLMHGVERCLWELFKGDEFIDTHYGYEIGDIPAYAQFEVILNNSQYASWMFEVDWVLGDDPSSESLDADDPDADDADDDDTDNGNGNGNIDPDRTREIDFSGGT
jgi:prepilin-type N-terminal cleavage/methylation domain-containing protein